MVEQTQTQILLRQRPTGLLSWDDLEVVTTATPKLEDGQALLENHYIGVDASVRSWLNPKPGYLPPVEIGAVVRAGSIGRVVQSRCDAYEVGDVVTSLGGLQRYAVIEDNLFSTNVGHTDDMCAVLAVYGSTGATAYLGLLDVGKPTEGDVLVVSAAAGATGSLVGQIGKIYGCHVIGICGSDEKVDWLTSDLGFDGAVNRRTEDVDERLTELCPKGIDIYFDNVGMPILNTVLGQIRNGARVVLCGAIAVYNETTKAPGPGNYLNLISRRAKMEGFFGP